VIDRIVPGDGLDAEVDRWFACHAAPRSAAALAHAAEAARAAMIRSLPALLGALERQYLDRLMKTHDAVEGITAFIERRSPKWRNA
jgi:cyclohexa-1,5-dienecarbonyl-CoA hydratase